MDLIQYIANDLNLDSNYIKKILKNSNLRYKDYYVGKEGHKRHIAQPSAELKTLQYWLVYNLFNKLPYSECASAYKKGDSIKKNAMMHKESRYLFHTDISLFFDSITPQMLIDVLCKHKDDLLIKDMDINDVADTITQICFRYNKLCIGAVSSPVISNVIMLDFDNELNAYCKEYRLTYSRYADDIYISSNKHIDGSIKNFVDNLLKKYNFRMNYKKTWFKSRRDKRKVTGLIITPDLRVTVGTEKKREIKKMIYDKLVHNKGDVNVIMGNLSYLKNIEPNVYDNYVIKYSKYCDGDIMDNLKFQANV